MITKSEPCVISETLTGGLCIGGPRKYLIGQSGDGVAYIGQITVKLYQWLSQ